MEGPASGVGSRVEVRRVWDGTSPHNFEMGFYFAGHTLIHRPGDLLMKGVSSCSCFGVRPTIPSTHLGSN